MGTRISRAALALVALSATVGLLTAARSAPVPSLGTLERQYVQVVKAVSPSVVQIENSLGLGSGIVFDRNGDIVTNAHVVGSDSTFKVTLPDGRQLTGKLVGRFVPGDLAVIKVDATGLKPAVFADSTRLEVGQIAIAIGNPLGLRSSVTEGIVSALGRTVPEGNGVILPDVIQTSAAINPGNSGGALVDLRGRVIGIPTLGASTSQFGGAAPGIGFAIPSSTVSDIVGQLTSGGKVVNSHRAYLGVRLSELVGTAGVLIGQVVTGGPADRAGLKAGDLITAIDGNPTASYYDLSTVLAERKPGRKVLVSVTHQDGTKATAKVTLGELPGS